MNKKKVIEKSIFILDEIYNHNIEPMIEAFGDDCIWIGPARNRIIQSKEKIREAYYQDYQIIKYAIKDRTVIPISEKHGNFTILFTYTMEALYPDDKILHRNCRAEMVWYSESVAQADGKRKRIPVLHIFQLSRELNYDPRDVIHPVHIKEVRENLLQYKVSPENRIIIKDVSGSIHFFDADEIIWIESYEKHSYVHTNKNVYECMDSVAVLAKRYKKHFLRCHSSYLINSAHVRGIERFSLLLSDGSKIPVPEKRYTAIKSLLIKWMQ